MLNFSLFFWCMQVPLLVLAAIYPMIVEEIGGGQEIRRLAKKYNQTYYMQVGVKEFVPFWTEGGGFLWRKDAFMTGLGVGSRVYLFVQLEFGAPKISDDLSELSRRQNSGVLKQEEAKKKIKGMTAGLVTGRVTPVLPVHNGKGGGVTGPRMTNRQTSEKRGSMQSAPSRRGSMTSPTPASGGPPKRGGMRTAASRRGSLTM
ncbi:hypothetical protein TrLO_g9319 [Triparma laevis f. longispina]|uniref:Uncharacterized protein n=2 Tax=Triparma laevis TaxID=1534972 RepID=A0A9W6ZLN8_9STRA|nr:hypothetical protein TrLO_g9319 [Triparma laevis f. longispina]